MSDELRTVRRTAKKAAAWREKLELEIREAHAGGASLRKIAEAAGVSHEQIRLVVKR